MDAPELDVGIAGLPRRGHGQTAAMLSPKDPSARLSLMSVCPAQKRASYEDVLNVPAHRENVAVRAEPFDAIELELSVLWAT